MKVGLDTKNGGRVAAYTLVVGMLVNIAVLIWNVATVKNRVESELSSLRETQTQILGEMESYNQRMLGVESSQLRIELQMENHISRHEREEGGQNE